MKPLHKALVCGTLFLCAAQVQASRVSGEVVQGELLVQAPDGSWQKGLPLVPGAQVKTEGKEALVSLGQSLVKISPDSQFQIKSLGKQEAELNLSACQGRVFVQVPAGSKLIAGFGCEQVASGEGEFVLGYGKRLGVLTFQGDVAASKGVTRVTDSEDWEVAGGFSADSDQSAGEGTEASNDDEEADTSSDTGYYVLGGVAGATGIALLINNNSSDRSNLFLAPASP